MPDEARYSHSELAQATRNHGMPTEAMRYDVTPTGLHYLLTHFDIPPTDRDTWSVSIGGSVSDPFEVSMDHLEALPSLTEIVTMECAGNGRAFLDPPVRSMPWLEGAVGNAEWTGTPLWPLLDEAGLSDDAVEVMFTGVDRGVEGENEQNYARSLTIDEVRRPEVMLVYAMNGAPLLPQHGAPLRLLVPGWYGMTSVKWLNSIEVLTEPFDGYMQTGLYMIRADEDDPGRPATRMLPRSLMIPPGIPDADSRHRFAEPGVHEIRGRAWSGLGEIVRVEFSSDGGATWLDSDFSGPVSRFGWQAWRTTWECESPGEYELCSRATDAGGRTQPNVSIWNVGGYENNGVERVSVSVV